uniref:RHS repeat domain-containing protein n=1 Tax=Flavobacterium adhaerens TaxID=3149043 RepID=UPI0032B39963
VGNTTAAPTQIVDYTYNIRGWLKGINDINSLGNDLFAFKINYNDITDVSKKLYNGNISQTFWKTANTDTSLRNYIYVYDALNRLKSATDNSGKLNETIYYDKNGNITNLTRLGEIVGGSTIPDINNASHFGVMDNLKYTYDTGNRLQIVSDSANDTYGFKDDLIGSSDDTTVDYTYDVNGNMKTDTNKGITDISYNHLNLPTKITFATSGNIAYIYNAAGQKVQKEVTQGSNITTTDYLGGYQYVKAGSNPVGLKFFPTAEGYVEAVTASSFKYIYQYKDHLGNVRLSYDKSLVIQEENNYYPFGLKHKGYNTGAPSTNDALKYKYNGKELQDELGLNMYDYGARNYDPALGRWMNIDPLAEEGRRWSPYNYAMDNPVYFTDPDGMLSQSFMDKIMNSASGTTWTNNNNGTFTSSSTGETTSDGENQEDPPKKKGLTAPTGYLTPQGKVGTDRSNDSYFSKLWSRLKGEGQWTDPETGISYLLNDDGTIMMRMPLGGAGALEYIGGGGAFKVTQIGGFYVRAKTFLSGGVFTKTVQSLASLEEGTSIVKLVKAFEAEAKSAGAKEIVIKGIDIVNKKLINTEAARRLGYVIEKITETSITISKKL